MCFLRAGWLTEKRTNANKLYPQSRIRSSDDLLQEAAETRPLGKSRMKMGKCIAMGNNNTSKDRVSLVG